MHLSFFQTCFWEHRIYLWISILIIWYCNTEINNRGPGTVSSSAGWSTTPCQHQGKHIHTLIYKHAPTHIHTHTQTLQSVVLFSSCCPAFKCVWQEGQIRLLWSLLASTSHNNIMTLLSKHWNRYVHARVDKYIMHAHKLNVPIVNVQWISIESLKLSMLREFLPKQMTFALHSTEFYLKYSDDCT